MLFFDLDGALVDSAAGITSSIAWTLEQLGYPPLPDAELHEWIGPALRASYGQLFDDDATVEHAVALYLERYDAVGIHQLTVFPDIADTVTTLHARGEHIALVSAKNERQARRIIEGLPFAHCFEEVTGATEDGSRSHKPELIAEAMRRSDVHADACVMIGDRHMDIEGAKHHGMRSVGVLWGFGSADELRTAGADLLVDAPRQLLQSLPVEVSVRHS